MTFLEYCKKNKPSILKEWNQEKNGPIDESLSFMSHKKYWFICSECGTEFMASPHSISYSLYNCCPNCCKRRRADGRHKAAIRKNNFSLQNKKLVSEFDIEKNGIDPSEISFKTNKQYWWKCSDCGFEWRASVSNRVKGTGCPHCAKVTHTSFPEQAIFYYVKSMFGDAINCDKHLGVELDIYIPSIKKAIEYDGEAWHQDRKKDEAKNIICADHGIHLIRIREENCWFWPMSKYLTCLSAKTGDNKSLTEALKRLFFLLREDLCIPDIDVNRDEKRIRAEYINAKKNNSIQYRFPELSKEWDYERNKPITPDKVDYGSGTKYWWICSKCNNSFEMSPNSRTYKHTNCPYCSHTLVKPGVTDLKTKYPQLIEEWDYEKNSALNIFPDKVFANSDKKVWWKCKKCGHEWEAIIGNRTRGKGCPLCARRQHMKKVINLDTNMVFNSVFDAGAYYGKPKNSHISDCCSGKRKTALGYRWAYIEKK